LDLQGRVIVAVQNFDKKRHTIPGNDLLNGRIGFNAQEAVETAQKLQIVVRDPLVHRGQILEIDRGSGLGGSIADVPHRGIGIRQPSIGRLFTAVKRIFILNILNVTGGPTDCTLQFKKATVGRGE
jgi:hypothetical protein